MKNLAVVSILLVQLLLGVSCELKKESKAAQVPKIEERSKPTEEIPADPFIWLEDRTSANSLKWVEAANLKTKNELTQDPNFEKNKEIVTQIALDPVKNIKLTLDSGYFYNFWQDTNNQRGLYRRILPGKDLKDPKNFETILDMDQLSAAENKKWSWKGMNCLETQKNLCLVTLSEGGGDTAQSREFDLNKKEFIKNGFFIPDSKNTSVWVDDNSLIVSGDFGPGSMTDSGYPRTNRLLKRNQKFEEAALLFEGDTKDVGVSSSVYREQGKTYIFHTRNVTFFEQQIYFQVAEGENVLLPIKGAVDFSGYFKGLLLFKINEEIIIDGIVLPQGSLASFSLADFLANKNLKSLSVLFKPTATKILDWVSFSKNYLYISFLNDLSEDVERWKLVQNQAQYSFVSEAILSKGTQNISIDSVDEESDALLIRKIEFLTPATLLYVKNPQDQIGEVIYQSSSYFDSSKFVVERYDSVSKDGTKIPYSVIRSKNMKFDGTNPVIMYGYGGFNISLTPQYLSSVGPAWLERGGVYAFTHIRGGGEFGPQWHLSAIKENRQKAYDDFISIAEDLITRKISSAKKIGISGGSNGGLLVGAVAVQRPDLFGAVVCQVPLLDMLRYHLLPPGASWMGEYGNPEIPEEKNYIEKYSPYQNLKSGVQYPPIFFMTSTQDDRVHPAHARKIAAKMESLNMPFYFYENVEGGHGGTSTVDQSIYWKSLELTYLQKQLM